MNILDLWNQVIANVRDEVARLSKDSTSEVKYPKRGERRLAVCRHTHPRRDVELWLDRETGVVSCRSGGPIEGGHLHYPDSKLFRLEATRVDDIVEWVMRRIFDDVYRRC